MAASLTPSTLPRSAHLVHLRAPRAERGDPILREPQARLRRFVEAHDHGALAAAILALLMSGGSRREHAAWVAHAQGLEDPDRLLADIELLPPALRLPWLEHLARSLALATVTVRHELIDASRQVMTADGIVSPLDQLRWIALRHLLAGSAVAPPAAAQGELETLDDQHARQVCLFSAFLSQLLPAPELTLDLSGFASLNAGWYASVIEPWQGRPQLPDREQHDIDASMRALRVLQTLPWLLRPVLVRHWFDAARALTDGPMLHPVAADALRLSCVLLDSPVPPELAQQYIEVEPAAH